MSTPKHIRRRAVALFMVIIIVIPPVFALRPHNAEAVAGAVGCATAGIGVGAGVGAVAAKLSVPTFDLPTFTAQSAETTKECLLDGLAKLLREVLIAQLVQSVVNWINSGFEGSPAFITDLGGFLRDAADEVIGTYIEGSQLSFLCSPFQLDIRIALRANFSEREPSCTLTEIVDNIEDFYKGSFSGGWRSFITVNTTTGNNPFFAYIDSDVKLRARLDAELQEELRKIDWGDGFRPFERCTEPGVGDDSGESVVICETVTPGTVINEQLNSHIESSLTQLELADEIDEILGALLAQLAKKVLTGSGGLLGASASSGGRSSFVSRAVSDAESRAESASRNVSSLTAQGSGDIEESYLEQKELSLLTLNVAESRIQDVISCYDEKLEASEPFGPGNPNQPTLDLTSEERDLAMQRVEQASSTIATNITPLKIQIERDIANARENIARLTDIEARVAAATSREEIELINENELNPLLESGVLHTQGDVASATQQKLDVDNLTNDLNEQTNQRQRACNEFPDGSAGPEGGDGSGGGSGF